MRPLAGHGPRVAATLLAVLLMLLHVAGAWRLPLLDRLDAWIYDARLRATLPVKAQDGGGKAYPYYEPTAVSSAASTAFEVSGD